MQARVFATVTLLGMLVCAAPVAGQRTRGTLIQEAREAPDDTARIDLLLHAADPANGGLDSLWAVGVFDLAQTLIMEDHGFDGALWLRLAARHGGRWPIDRAFYAPSTVLGYDRALPAVRTTGGLGPPAVSTSWRWPATFERRADGALDVTNARPTVPLKVTVSGHGELSAGAPLELEPGSYDVVASASGHETVRVTREVLPGATTVLGFDLPPLLPREASEKIAPSLVTVRFRVGSRLLCTNGLVATVDGLVLTTSALGRSTDLTIETAGGVFQDVTVAIVDAGSGLAVLRLHGSAQEAPAAAGHVVDDDFVWTLYHDGCHDAASARSRITEWEGDGGAKAGLSPALPLAASGSPLFDQRGLLVGIVTGPEQVVPMAAARRLLDRASRTTVAQAPVPLEPDVSSAGPRLPWRWIGAGAAAVGVAAAFIGGAIGNGSGSGPPHPETGGIKVTLPGGGSP